MDHLVHRKVGEPSNALGFDQLKKRERPIMHLMHKGEKRLFKVLMHENKTSKMDVGSGSYMAFGASWVSISVPVQPLVHGLLQTANRGAIRHVGPRARGLLWTWEES